MQKARLHAQGGSETREIEKQIEEERRERRKRKKRRKRERARGRDGGKERGKGKRERLIDSQQRAVNVLAELLGSSLSARFGNRSDHEPSRAMSCHLWLGSRSRSSLWPTSRTRRLLLGYRWLSKLWSLFGYPKY